MEKRDKNLMFEYRDLFDYHIKGSRTENCILIASDNWYVNTSNAIISVNSRGGISNTYITEALAVNVHEGSKYEGLVSDGDMVLLTSVSTRVYCARTFSLPFEYDCTRYTDIPMAHVIGVFKPRTLSLDSLNIFGTYVVLEPYEEEDEGSLQLSTQINRTVYKVLKVGRDVTQVSVGDIVLTRDNIVTEIWLGGQPYSMTTEDMLVGKFNGPIKLENVEPLHNCIIMEDYMSDTVEGSSILLNPSYDVHADEDQRSEVYNEDRFKVLLSASEGINVGDILDIVREATNYTTLNGITYFVTYGKQFINAKIH